MATPPSKVYSADLVSLVRSSDLSYSDCQDGEFRLCVACGGTGRVLSLDSTPVSESECEDCWGGRTFNVSLPDQAAAYQSLLRRYAEPVSV